MHRTGISLATIAFLLAAAPAIALAAPTASFTVNGKSAVTLHVGDTLTYAWSSTNAVSAHTTYMVDGTGPFDGNVNTTSGTYSETVTYKGDVTTFTYTVTDSSGKTASAHAVVKVLSGAVQNAAKTVADREITRRITALNDLNIKVGAMLKVSASVKSSISAEVTTEVANLNALKTKIDADTDTATLKTDIRSLTQSYRIFMLIIPQARIAIAADKIATVAASLTTLAGKLQTRIASAQAAGKDVSALSSSLSDMNAKVADANTQASGAVSATASLTPDNGDQTKASANAAALKAARAQLQTALKDLETARADAKSIVQGLKAVGSTALSATFTINGSANATVKVGDTVTYAWNSTGAASAQANWTQDSTSCGYSGTGPFTFFGTKASTAAVLTGSMSEPVTDCWAGHTYSVTYTATDSQGKTTNATATITMSQ